MNKEKLDKNRGKEQRKGKNKVHPPTEKSRFHTKTSI